jgi:hypothetical protein
MGLGSGIRKEPIPGPGSVSRDQKGWYCDAHPAQQIYINSFW